MFRFERYYRATSELGTWGEFCREALANPQFVFSCMGDVQTAQEVYAINWT